MPLITVLTRYAMIRHRKFIFVIIIALLLVGIAVYYVNDYREEQLSKTQKITIRRLQEMMNGEISYEERSGIIMVTVTDRYRDSHIYVLDYSGMTNERALRTIEKKIKKLRL
jgi:regulatory protein YycI of two-component signal transduction system YycFG